MDGANDKRMSLLVKRMVKFKDVVVAANSCARIDLDDHKAMASNQFIFFFDQLFEFIS